MTPNNDGSTSVTANNKGKMKEPSSATAMQQQPTNVFSLQQSSDFQFHFNSQQQQRSTELETEPDILDKYMSKPFTSYTALLTDEDDDDNLSAPLKYMHDQVDKIIETNTGELNKMLFDVHKRNYYNLVSAAKQEATNKLMEKEEELSKTKMKILELEQSVDQLNNQNGFLETRIRDLERSNRVQESSSVGQNRVQPRNYLGRCRACFNAQVTVIIGPCRHLCLCASCATIVNVCPVCQAPKLHTYEIMLP